MGIADYTATIASGLGSGLFNFIGNAVNNWTNRQIAQEQMLWQQQENETAFQRDLKMWDLQNQYNSPAAQRARIEAAGGNPMLAFGNGINVTSGNASGAPQYKPATAITPTMNAYTGWNLGLENIDALLRKDKQLQLIEEVNNAQIRKSDAETLSILQNTSHSQSMFPYILEAKRELAKQLYLGNREQEQRYTYNEEMYKLQLESAKIGIDTKNFDLKYKEEVRAYRVALEALNIAEKQTGIVLSKAQQHKLIQEASKIGFEKLKLKQDIDITKFWDNIQRRLGPKTSSPIASLFHQFIYLVMQKLNSF